MLDAILTAAQHVGATLGVALILIVVVGVFARVDFERSSGETNHDRRITEMVGTILAAYQQEGTGQ